MSTPSVARGPYRNGIRRREQIVAKASEVFGELGYVGGSLRTIAERVGVTPASLLQHFGSKEGLLEAVLEDWSEQTGAQYLGTDLHGLAAFEAFRELMAFHLEHRGLLELFLTMAAEATNVAHPARRFIQQRYASGLARQAHALSEARDTGEVGPLTDEQIGAEASMFYAVLDGLELQWLLDSRVDLVGLFDRYLDSAIARWRIGLPE
ncbi:TetR/AcrR family transcriptional regulator [Microlunatus antarcticus]|uniref:AcrR family transcriptional regulator n=1 Tax=Microlunatus antarcticus TaxID=53388 RepID=A0A7W5P6E3_9ACTN|nr:TetR/AcrR family transcriptional regulator [Microlunatus antarcticus]MBB3326420.1 AcrR family transcriptional regulator [Microlunatus antarcticus]